MKLPLTKLLASACIVNLAHAQVNLEMEFDNYVNGTVLDQANSAAGQWYDGLNGIVFNDIVDTSQSGFNIGMTVEATSSWSTFAADARTRYNRNNTDDIRINILRDTQIDLKVTFYDVSNATPTLISPSTFGSDFTYNMTFYDLDGDNTNGLDTVNVSDFAKFQVAALNDLNVINNSDGSVTVGADGNGSFPGVTAGATSLTAEQQRGLAIFQFANTASFDLIYSAPNVDGGNNGGRNLAIDGNDFNFSVPTIPEPSSTALLGFGGLALLLRRKK